MAKVKIQKCPKCGAPLKLTQGVSDVACEYCRTMVHIEWGKKAPPPQQQQPLTIYVSNPLPAIVPILIVLGLLFPLGGGIIAFFASAFGGVASSAVQAVNLAGIQTPGTLVSKTLPATCGMNQEIQIVGQKFEGPGPLITGEVNCKVKIKDSTLKSDVVVLAKNLVEVTVENSTLQGKEAAVKLTMNSKLFGKKNAVIKGEEAAVVAGVNSEISLEEASIDGGETGIQGDTNLRITANKSKIVGKEYGIRSSSSNLTLEGKELTLRGERAALEGQFNLKLDLRGGLVEGNETAIHMKGSNAEIRLSRAAQVKGREVAVKTQTNLSLEMEDALIDGAEIGIETGTNPKLTLGPKSRIHGKRVALKVGVNLEIDARGATIDSEAVAICAPFNVEISARDSKFIGGADAFRFERRPRELELVGSSVSGKQRFDARGCGTR